MRGHRCNSWFHAVGHKNTVIYAQSKDKGGNDDVKNVELQMEQAHNSDSDYPSDNNWNDGHQR